MKKIDARNEREISKGGSAVHGITKFIDMSSAEFKSKILGADPSLKSKTRNINYIRESPANEPLVDWSGKYTTPVKNQEQCGSCWAFSATEQIESDAMRTLGTTYILSPEQIVQCDSNAYGCNGGWSESAYQYVQDNGGIEQNSDYPYTSGGGDTGTCQADNSKDVLDVTGFSTVSGDNVEAAMATYVQTTGPLSVCLAADTWMSYTGGVISSCDDAVDHCVQAVGVDIQNGFWKVRNSWGADWGESGYIRLAYGSNLCDITNDPTYASVKKV